MIVDRILSHRHFGMQGIFVFAVCFTGRLITFPGITDVRFDLQWLAVVMTAWLVPFIPAGIGIVAASVVSHFFVLARADLLVYGTASHLYEISFTVGMLGALGWIRWGKCRIRAGLTLKSISILCPLGLSFFLSMVHPAHGYSWVYFVAALIITVLALIKTRSLKPMFWVIFTGWEIGYGLFLYAGWSLSVDLNSAGSGIAYLQRLFLIPYPVYVLEIILAAVLITMLSEETASSTS